jgi:DNA repair exonuclease SbcCD ATPase subunit
MSRQIYLPELLSINIKNYTLYPHGLNYTYDFVKGINLILGGNGMGKTTFVNIIKFGLIGLYRKGKDLTRTYKERAIVRRLWYPADYFAARQDDTIAVDGETMVFISFKIKDTLFEVTRSLKNGCLHEVIVNGIKIEGEILPEERYERIEDTELQKKYLLNKYEKEIALYSNLTFDDLIFFVNEILFFGENHNTVLWNDGIDGRTDVQNELFNKYFNEPDLDMERQEMQRQARYFDSLARHKSEDMRVITSLLKKLNADSTPPTQEASLTVDIIALKEQIEKMTTDMLAIHETQKAMSNEIAILQGEINRDSIQASMLDDEKKKIEKEMNASLWETMHPLYDVFLKNIQLNHICPICSQEAEKLVEEVNASSTRCFVCGNELHLMKDEELSAKYKHVTSEHKSIYQSIANKQRRIKAIEERLGALDKDFREKDLRRRILQQQLREQEYSRSNAVETDKLQALDDEYNKYAREKEEYQKQSEAFAVKAQLLTNKIEDEILSNVSRFSSIFASYAEKFLGVSCSLEYNSYDGRPKRFYPVIDGRVRKQEEALSESQRFFIDHSFRMSILTFFYQTPSFYIVETPDSSLDLSYERNAAEVFLQFLRKPNIVIVTSNLNNSSFIDHLTTNKSIPFSMVGLLDIAKRSAIQGSNERIQTIYDDIKNRIQ